MFQEDWKVVSVTHRWWAVGVTQISTEQQPHLERENLWLKWSWQEKSFTWWKVDEMLWFGSKIYNFVCVKKSWVVTYLRSILEIVQNPCINKGRRLLSFPPLSVSCFQPIAVTRRKSKRLRKYQFFSCSFASTMHEGCWETSEKRKITPLYKRFLLHLSFIVCAILNWRTIW